ncbi:6338_t:CDS:2, partial [Paraglomus occultum]
EYLAAISKNPNICTPSQSSGSGMASTEQDEHQLVSEQKANHQVFEAFCNVIREATDMVISGKVFSFMGSPDAGCLDLAKVFPEGYDFGEHESLVNIAPIPGNVSALIEAGFFSFGHFENLFYGCIGGMVRKEPELFAQIRKEINSKSTEDLTIAGATSHHAIRQASLMEVYTSVTNMWMARMARYQDTQLRKAKKKQMEKEQRNLDRRFRNSKCQIPRLMDELSMAIINERPAS